MKEAFNLYRTIFLFFLIFGCNPNKEPSVIKEEISAINKFTLLPSSETNITFQNTLEEGLNANVLVYEYLYNGGGVATADFNGDSLIDVYFTSNMGNNAFYLNKGKLQFENTTNISKITGRPGPWKTGVTVVDINGDNKLDVYLCYSGAMPTQKRKNQLFVNQGNNKDGVPIFKEQAAKYGLDSPAYSNQAYFLDYDRDGDLDVFLLNHNPKSLPVLNEVSTQEFLKKEDPLRGLRLYKQTNGLFNDVTQSAGISGSSLSYGLGLGLSDVNNDGWIDAYVSNDYTIPDYLYLNNGDGTFTNHLKESMGHISHFSMGNDIADINNDGWQDIFTLDMLPEDNKRQKLLLSPDNYEKFNLNIRSGFHYQYMRNMMQLNNGDGTYSEIAQMAGISNTDWSWAPLFADYDNDGRKDLYITNGYFRDYTNLDFINYMEDYVQSKGRLKREDVLEIIKKMPASDVTNYMFKNQTGTTFSNETKNFGLNHVANSNGASYADLDNDGDLDLVVNNINKEAFVYKNLSQENGESNYLQVKLNGNKGNTQGIGAKVMLYNDEVVQRLDQAVTKGYLSSVSPLLHFGLGENKKIDSLKVIWNTGKEEVLYNVEGNRILFFKEENAINSSDLKKEKTSFFTEIRSPINFRNEDILVNDFKRQPLLIKELSHEGPCMIKADINKDGLEDIFIGGAKNQVAAIYIQQQDHSFKPKSITAFYSDKQYQDADAAFLDANQDGNIDIYVASGGYHNINSNDDLLQDRIYLGDGSGNFIKGKDMLPDTSSSSKGVVVINDINKDGFPDIYVGGKIIPGQYPRIPESYLLINNGTGKFSNQIESIAPELEEYGMVTDVVWIDVNKDSIKDLIVVGEWLPISVFINKDGKLVNKTEQYLPDNLSGWWNNIEVADFNNDGQLDFIVGNIGTNTQFSASKKEPVTLHYKDFDNNSTIDPMFSFYIAGKSYPYLTRDELLGQLAGLKSKYNSYEGYADASLMDVFGAEKLKNAGLLQANNLKTTLLLSQANGKYLREVLPAEVQNSQVNSFTVWDVDSDGDLDILLFGNDYHYKLRLGKFDANYGMLLLNNGLGYFKYVNQISSGFQVKGAVKSSLKINNTLFLGINNEAVKAYKLN